MEVRFDALKRPAWERLCDAHHAPLQQRLAYGDAIALIGGTVLRLTVQDGGKPVALAQVLVRRVIWRCALLSRGPVWMADTSASQRHLVLNAIRDALRQRGVRCLVLTPEQPAKPLFGWPIMTPPTIGLLPLSDDMRAKLHGKWRNRLVKAETSGLTVKCLTRRATDHDWLFDNENRQRSDRGYKTLPPAVSDAWLQAPTARSLTLIARGRTPLAGMMFLRHGNTATYHLGWTSGEGRAGSAHTLMMWQAMARLQAEGVAQLDLGLLDTERTPGLARFKLGTGAKPHRLGATTLSF